MKNKFGMFIHWGLYSQLEEHEQVLARDDMDNKDYEKLIHQFNPVKYDPEQWVLMAKNAGMKYICFTTKHHDGFCMWDTQYTDYNVMNTPYGKDVLRMLADACEKHGMLLSLYYSNPDWHHESAYNPLSTHQWKSVNKEKSDPVKYREYIRHQLSELLTNYGKIYSLFWDISPYYIDESMNEYVRSLVPDILINDRGYDKGDFSTPEREIPDGTRFRSNTEACQSVGIQSWGFRKNEDFYSCRFLMSSIDKIMSMGGSYVLNVGPKSDGTIDPVSRKMVERIGKWYQAVGLALEDTEEDRRWYVLDDLSPIDPFIVVRKDNKTYLHLYEGVSATCITFSSITFVPKKAVLLNNRKELTIRYEKLPAHFDAAGVSQGPFVSLCGIPADELCEEPIVIELS